MKVVHKTATLLLGVCFCIGISSEPVLNRQTLSASACVDSIECASLATDGCSHGDIELLELLCPVSCGRCVCADNPEVNCTAFLPEVCHTETRFTLCARTCGVCSLPAITTAEPSTLTTLTMLATPTTVAALSTTSPPTTVATTKVTTPNTACDNNPCLFGGRCAPAGDGSFTCFCAAGYSPPLCLPGAQAQVCDPAPFDGCEPAEVVFLITYSRYVEGDDIDHEGDYITALIEQYRVDAGHVRVGVVVYHDDALQAISIEDFASDKPALVSRVRELCRERNGALTPSGYPNISRALRFVSDNSFKAARPGVKKVVVSIIHKINRSVFGPLPVDVTSLTQDCVQLFVKAVTRSERTATDIKQATGVSQAPFFERFDDFDELKEEADGISPNICGT